MENKINDIKDVRNNILDYFNALQLNFSSQINILQNLIKSSNNKNDKTNFNNKETIYDIHTNTLQNSIYISDEIKKINLLDIKANNSDKKLINTTIYGGTGNDIYTFGKGYGQNKIIDAGGIDTIRLVNATIPDDLNFYRIGNSLELRVKTTSDSLNLDSWFTNPDQVIEKLQIAKSGTISNISDYKDRFVGLLEGSSTNDTLIGFENMKNLFDGKQGNDFMYGRELQDTYIFGKGYGQDSLFDLGGSDTIKFNADTDKSEVEFYRVNNDMQIRIKGTSDSLNIDNWFVSDQQKIEQFSFTKDNSSFSANDIKDYKGWVQGTDGNETLQGWTTDDIIIGGKGNDTLYGLEGNDTYLFNKGDGNDFVADTQGNDEIIFGKDISKNDISFFKVDNDLKINYGNGDEITIANQFFQPFTIEKISLNDGSFLSNNDINLIIQNMASYSQEKGLTLTSATDVKSNSELMTVISNSWHK
ncbi:MAG: calcium-binding protein [bacterium]